jgi:hypothetical protein
VIPGTGVGQSAGFRKLFSAAELDAIAWLATGSGGATLFAAAHLAGLGMLQLVAVRLALTATRIEATGQPISAATRKALTAVLVASQGRTDTAAVRRAIASSQVSGTGQGNLAATRRAVIAAEMAAGGVGMAAGTRRAVVAGQLAGFGYGHAGGLIRTFGASQIAGGGFAQAGAGLRLLVAVNLTAQGSLAIGLASGETIEEALAAVLQASPYPTIAQSRAYSHRAPERAAIPYMVFEHLEPFPDHTHAGPPSRLIIRSYRFWTFAVRQDDTSTMVDELRSLFSGFTGTMHQLRVVGMRELDASSDFEEVTKLHCAWIDFEVAYIRG